jgi:hypothetical protein
VHFLSGSEAAYDDRISTLIGYPFNADPIEYAFREGLLSMVP